MPLLLSAIPWRLVAVLGIAAGIALGAMYIAAQLKKIGVLQAQVTQATATANANAAEAKRLKIENERILAEAALAAEAKSAIRRSGSKRREAISAAHVTDDGPLAPVARRWLDGLPIDAPSSGARDTTSAPDGAKRASNAVRSTN